LFRCCVWQGGGGAILNQKGGSLVVTESKFVKNTAYVSDLVCVHNLVVYYSSKTSFRPIFDTAAILGRTLPHTAYSID
jgi:hypothetical protein